jgi:hypothetical protein
MNPSLGHTGLAALLLAALGLSSPLPVAAQGAALVIPDSTAPDTSAGPTPTDPYLQRERARLRRRATFDPSARRRPVQDSAAVGAPRVGQGAFRVVVRTDAPEYVADEEDGDPMFIEVRSSADGFLTLLSSGTGPELTILAPNDLVAQLPVRAGVPLVFPLREWIRQGIELRPRVPEGVDVSQQAIFAVVTRRPVSLPPYDYGTGAPPTAANTIAFRTFQAWLARLPAADRGVGQAFYTVRRP